MELSDPKKGPLNERDVTFQGGFVTQEQHLTCTALCSPAGLTKEVV